MHFSSIFLCKVIDLNIIYFIFGISSLFFFLIALFVNITLRANSQKYPLLFAIAKSNKYKGSNKVKKLRMNVQNQVGRAITKWGILQYWKNYKFHTAPNIFLR